MDFRKFKGLWIAVGAGAAVLFFMITLSQLNYRTSAREILQQGKTVPATVTSLSNRPRWADDPKAGGRRTFVTVRYPDEKGRLQENIAWQYIGWTEVRNLHVGDPVEVIYLPHRIYTPYLKPSLTRLANSGWLAALSGVGFTLGLATLVWGLFLKTPPIEAPEGVASPASD